MSLLRRLFRRSVKETGSSVVKGTPEITKLVTFIGLGFAGKTTILQRLRTGEFHGHSTRTMGLNVDHFVYRNVKFQCFDLGGQESFHMIWGDYLQLASAVVFVVDCSNPDSFEESKKALYYALPDIKPNGILLLAANKADLSGVDPYVLLLQHFDLYEIQQKGQFKAVNIFHMSAKSGVNFYQAFDWLIETLTGEVIMPQIKVHSVCIYQTSSGLLVVTSARESEVAYDPSMLTSMFSAVNTFAKASLGAGVREILMKRTGESEIDEDYKLVRVEDSDYSVILIVDESDSMRKSITIGKDLLNWTRIQRASINDLDMETIDETEIQIYLKLKYPDDFQTLSLSSS
jgi:small GTP-binding protein